MHSADMPSGATIHYSSDLSGEVKITLPVKMLEDLKLQSPVLTRFADNDFWTVEIPASDLVDFVLDHFLREGIGILENLIGMGTLRMRLRELEEWSRRTPRGR